MVEEYLKAQGLFRTYDGSQPDPDYSGDIMELDLGSILPSVAGPKRPHDRVGVADMRQDFNKCLTAKIGFKGFGLDEVAAKKTVKIDYEGKSYELKHGSLVIAAITSCTNTSNPDVMIASGLLARNAVKKGLSIAPYIKTSLSPGSGVVTKYFEESGVDKYLDQLGFSTTGYGCMTCIGNSGEIPESVQAAIIDHDLVASAVLSGNRNFEGRVHPHTRANYLASPPLVVAYALAGRCDIDFETEPLGKDKSGKDVFLKEIWPSRDEITTVSAGSIKPKMFEEVYEKISKGTDNWNKL
jgi:aconitate hydratase